MATMATTTQNEISSPSQLPTFVFPARASPSSAPASFSRATGRRPTSTPPPELPSFSFNSTTSTTSPIASPPVSPSFANFDVANPSRGTSHRRGTSEFIGGDGKVGSSAGLMSTSPTQGDNSLPSPTPGRRGHAHRRSAAVSAHDIRMILNPNPPNPLPFKRGGSAPASPAGHEHKEGILGLAKPASSDDACPKVLNRARVGFSDNVEFIPRPLSIISSDTSSTVTMRQSHSVSGSLSSIVSGGNSSPPNKDIFALPPPKLRGVDTRPSTSSAIPEPVKITGQQQEACPSPRRRGSMPLLDDITFVAPPSPRKKWNFFGHETASGNSSPVRSRPVSSTSIDRAPDTVTSTSEPSSPKINSIDVPMPFIEPSSSRRSSISRKSVKKQKKVKSWAGSILSRKPRSRNQKKKTGRRSATPPMRPYTAMSDSAALNRTPLSTHSEYPSPSEDQERDFISWKPRQVPPQDDDAMSPIIDLDAALGPFNTPSGFDPVWDASQKTSSKRRMHSAAGMGGFIGPGMHYHRRAESAPEMVPFENRFGIHRLGSSSTMADVFEEDEEDDEWEDAKASSDKDSLSRSDDDENALGIDIDVDGNADSDETNPRGLKRKGSGLSESERRHVTSSMKSERSTTSLQDEPIMEEDSVDPIEIADDSIPPRPDSGAQSSESTATPPFRPKPAKDLAPVEINPFSLQPGYLSPNSPHSTGQSSFPSPRSPFSYDTQRISTAPSSFTDEHAFQSLLLGEPGPELRMSVDDVPSLTSSNSTMTRESGANPGTTFRDGQRSVSVSSASGQTRKRSSMASLTRLISSSHGERSKLSIESRAPSNTDSERKDKESKSKRISRLIQFWKPKEKDLQESP